MNEEFEKWALDNKMPIGERLDGDGIPSPRESLMAYDMAIGMIFGLASGGIAGWIAHKTVQAIKDDQTPSVDVYTDAAGNIKDVTCSDHVHLRFRDQRDVVDRWKDNRVKTHSYQD